MIRSMKKFSFLHFSLVGLCFAQIVSFNSPQEWSTLRGNSFVAKTLVDTSKTKGEKISFYINKIENGEKKQIAVKAISGKEYRRCQGSY